MEGGLGMTYKDKARRDIDAHIESTKGRKTATGKMKGSKEDAWREIVAFRAILEATKA